MFFYATCGYLLCCIVLSFRWLFLSAFFKSEVKSSTYFGFSIKTLAARGLEERRNFKELLTESVGRVHFS